MSSKRKTIVVSAVSLRKGGTLTILQDCLCYLSALAADGNYRTGLNTKCGMNEM